MIEVEDQLRALADLMARGQRPIALDEVRRRPSPRRRPGRRVSALAAAAVAAIVLTAAVAIAIGARGSRGASVRVSPTTATTTATTALPSSDPGLRVVFTHTGPDGAVVTARAGDVSIAEAHGCDRPVPLESPSGIDCVVGVAPGIQFEFSAPGSPKYRITVVTHDFPVDASYPLRPLSIASLVRLVRADGSTIPAPPTRRVEIAAFRSVGVATVRVEVGGTATDTMAPVDGWTAFAAGTAELPGELFGITVDGLDATGAVIATTIPYRCC